jgi:hypothetical protein
MKNTNNRVSKPGRRTHTLKALLEGQDDINTAAIEASTKTDHNPDSAVPNLKEIKEDLLFANLEESNKVTIVQLGSDQSIQSKANASTLSQTISLFDDLIGKEMTRAANLLEINESELKAWIDLQIEVPAKTILNLLRTMQNLCLDPLSEEIGFTQYEDGNWQVFITIEGCSKLLNNHSQFNGLVFNQADTLVEGIPEWIECSIYRSDRTMPITVREYFVEVRNNKEIWKKMPRRMLRHRALQQCVRLAIA